MRRHVPSHQQNIQNVEDPDDPDGAHWTIRRQPPYNSPSISNSPHRLKLRKHVLSFNSDNSNTTPSNTPRKFLKYSDIYSQFVRRYRSEPGIEDDPRTDPDSHYFQRGLGQLVDAADSDDEDLSRVTTTSGEAIDRISALVPESESPHPATLKERERLEWQTMLASVLDGDVLRSEKKRIAVALESSAEEQNSTHLNIWLGIRAKLHATTEEEERKVLEEWRLRTVDPVIEEIMSFRFDSSTAPDATSALKQVNALMRRLDVAQSLYPNLKAFHLDNPASTSPEFQARCDTLNTWSTLLTSLRRQIALLRRWTGSDTLDVTQPNTNAEVAIGSNPAHLVKGGRTEIADGTSFVERVLKEESIQRTFEKGFLTTVHSFIGATRDAQVNLSALWKAMNLPTFENELVPLISFPTKLARAGLCVHLDHVQKLSDPDILIIDQVIEDLKLTIGLACTLKRQYEAFLEPDPGGNWNLPQCISEDYEATILEALSVFFRLLHWKLTSGAKGIYFKETDVLEAQWATFNDVSMTVAGGSSLVAEQLCALTNKLMLRVTNYFETQVRVPVSEDSPSDRTLKTTVNGGKPSSHTHVHSSTNRKMTGEQMLRWYSKILDNVRLRYRKLQRFARVLTQRFSNSAEYNLEDVPLEHFISNLVATDHFLVYTQSFEEDGTYIIAPSILRERPDAIRRILGEAFHVNEVVTDDGIPMAGYTDFMEDEYDDGGYLLLLSPRSQFLWNGLVLLLEIPKIELELKDNRVRLVADGAQRRLAFAKQQFAETFLPVDEDDELIETGVGPITCLVDQQAHLPGVNRELRKIARTSNRLAESIVYSVHHVRSSLPAANGCQEMLENWYSFAAEHGQHAQKFMDHAALIKFNPLLVRLAISWVSFICDNCDPTDRKTFKWAVSALEFTQHGTRRSNILQVPDEQFELLRQGVAGCMTFLMSHFDILGARSTIEAKKEKEKQEDMLRQQTSQARLDDITQPFSCDSGDSPVNPEPYAYTDSSTHLFWEKAARSIRQLEGQRAIETKYSALGRVLDAEKPEDRSLVFLASSTWNISIRWQQGRFIGAGAFGSVYLAVNLDSGSLMAVKEIKFQEFSGSPNLYTQIKDELGVMQMLHHPNVVEYYGIEVHRDKVYIFEEYCQGGSLAALLEHGRIEDEGIIQVYTMQMLEGLAYLHSNGIAHRDIKPDNILLDHMGVIKFVDFGAAKILAKGHRTVQRSRRSHEIHSSPTPPSVTNPLPGRTLENSLTGTPMYMSPEIIKNDQQGRHGAMDIWALGCVVLECATGKKPWSNLDNEWAIMFHIGVATQHPPLPEPGQLGDLGICFIKECLTIDPIKRPTAIELMDDLWILEFREALLRYEESEIAARPVGDIPAEESFESPIP